MTFLNFQWFEPHLLIKNLLIKRNECNSSSKCPFHQVMTSNAQSWLMAQMKACDMPMQEFISLSLPGQVDGHIVVLQHDEAGLWLFNFSELSLVKTTAALVVYLLNKSFKPYTRSKKSIVDFESRRGAGKKKKKHCVITSCFGIAHLPSDFCLSDIPLSGLDFSPSDICLSQDKQTFAYPDICLSI